jgi:hypothetical protein
MISVSTNGTGQSALYKSTAICTTIKDKGEVKGEKNWDGLVKKVQIIEYLYVFLYM